MAIRSLARASSMSLNDALFMQSSSSIAGRETSRCRAIAISKLYTGQASPRGLRHFSTTRDVRKDKEGRRYHPHVEEEEEELCREKRKSGHPSDPFQTGGDAPCDASSKQSGQKDFFGLRGDQRTTPPVSFSFVVPFLFFLVVSFNG